MNNIKISLRNYSKDKERYKKYRKQLLELLNENNSKLNFDLKIIAVIYDSDGNDSIDESDDIFSPMRTVIKDDKAYIVISPIIFDFFDRNGEYFLHVCLLHEFCHIDDLHYIATFPYFKGHTIDSFELNSIKNVNINTGILFWTEYYAYSKTFANFKKFDQYISIYDLEKTYTILQNEIANVKNEDVEDKLVLDVINSVCEYTHLFAMNLASTKFGDKRKIKDKNKIYDEKTHEIVIGMIEKFSYYVNELTKYRNDNKFVTYLRKLGHYINFEFNAFFDSKVKKQGKSFVRYIDNED